jgi:hypothetical protein
MLSLVAVLVPAGAQAQVAKQGNTSLDGLAFTSPRLSAGESLDTLDNVQALLPAAVSNAWAAFRVGAGGEWNALVDKRTGRVEIAEGSGIAWIPGRGNSLTPKDLLDQLGTTKVDLTAMDTITRGFLPRVTAALGIDPASLVLNKGRSGQQADYLWFVDYDVLAADGTPIEGARVVFRINHGNLIQFGTENLPAGGVAPKATVKKETALANLARYIGGFSAADSFLDDGSAHTLALGKVDNRFADGFQFGNGRGVGQVWEFTFHRDGVMGNWRARVDASTGEVLELKDTNDYATAQVTGGVFLNSPTTGAEVVRPMPFADVSGVGASSSAGTYNFTGGTPVSTLNGTYVKITDTCGAISQAADGSGNIAFGTSAGTDCTTPGHGGAGNTHSTRTQFYQINRIKEVGRGWLPTNTWLNAKVTVNVNLNQTCNAYWQPATGTLNFFRSGGGCNNTGEIAAVSLHEFGHGIDQNDGTGTAPEGGTGEAYGDTTAVIALHNSCIGPGFLGSNCAGYGNACTACTGVRDVDFAKHATGVAATVANHTQVRCGAGSGPCGKEVHCESYVPSEAIWDFANRDLPGPGTGPAWTVLDRLWYLSRNTATSSFTCTTGGTFTSNGCGTGNWWKTMRAVDDDDGNLANGTPHSGALFAAFNRHGIACTTDAGASTTFAGCTAPTAPALTLTAGDNSAGLSWTNSGAGVVYDIYRNEAGCNAGFTKIVNDSTSTSLTDGAVANGLTYYYQIIAHPTGTEACGGAPSTCVSVTPVSAPCTPPVAPPTGVTATTASATAINVAWTAAVGASEYHVYRSTTTGGPYSLVGTTAGTSFSDTGLTCNTTYFYVVRAANSPTCETGNSAQASATTSTCPICTTTTLYSHNFDAATGLDGFTTGFFNTGGSAVDWRGVQTCTAHTGARIFRFGGTGCTTAYGNNRFSFSQPNGAAGITVPAGSTVTRLSFWHRRGFESGFDGGTLTVSVDGTNYSFVPGSAVLTGAYNGTISASCPPAGAAGASAWTGSSSTFTNTTVDLDAACNVASGGTGGCAGKAVRIGFTGITDCSVTSSGWFLDDVTVTACTP